MSEDINKENQEEILKEYVDKEEIVKDKDKDKDIPKVSQVGPKITEVPDPKLPGKKEYSMGNNLGWIPLKMEDFPSRGLFYPKNSKISIRSATGGEIRHWSTLQEDDLSALDDMLNYIIERCVTIKPGDPKEGHLSWKDIKEVDRFYILLAIHELTFPEGENKLQVKVSDTKKIDVVKDMISYITLDPKLMKYYNEEERCFVLKLKKGGNIIKLDIPCVGVTQWLKNYIIRKQSLEEYIDEDYLTFAPFIIRNWRGLTEDIYSKFVEDSHKWDVTTISLLVKFKEIFADTLDPIITYIDEGGAEQVAPLNFQGGIKSLFLISDPFAELE